MGILSINEGSSIASITVYLDMTKHCYSTICISLVLSLVMFICNYIFNDNNKLNPPKILFSYKLLGDPYIESTIYYNPDIQYIVSGNLHTSEGVQTA